MLSKRRGQHNMDTLGTALKDASKYERLPRPEGSFVDL